MKQIPILFSTPMVQAIMDGRKTMTRRTKGLEVTNDRLAGQQAQWHHINQFAEHIIRVQVDGGSYLFNAGKCPYGKPGDVLWVRETCLWVMKDHAHDLLEGNRDGIQWVYKASQGEDWIEYAKEKYGYKWKPSIHMPKDAARIWLRITSVRVERLQDISEEDCIREGIDKSVGDLAGRYMKYGVPDTAPFYARFPFLQPRDSFKSLWEYINGEDSWQTNPFVWVIEFEQIEKPE